MAEELRCMTGCDTAARDPAAMLTPGQLLHHLHTLDADSRVRLAGRLLESQEAAERCFVYGHDARLAEWAERVVYLEARVGELHQTIGDLRTGWRGADQAHARDVYLLLWLHAEAVHEAADLDDRRARWALEHQKRSEELKRSEASRQAWAEEAMRLDALVREALELLNDVIGYVPEFFQEKWDYPAEIASIASRRPQCAVHPDGETA